jgi:branched-chain amino acid transport system permease protein
LQTENKSKTKPKSRLGSIGMFRRSYNVSPFVTLIFLVCAGFLPLAVGTHNQSALIQYVIYLMWITLAESWNLIGGYANLINLGMGAFFGIGVVLTSTFLFAGINFPTAMILSGFAGAGLALLLTPTFRLRTDYFAIGSLVIPFVLKPLVEFFAGKTSFDLPTGTFFDPTRFYYLGLAMVAASVFGVFFLMRSRIGIALRSIGDDEVASASVGINVLQSKMIALVISGFIASVAGAYYLGILGASNTSIFDDLTYSLFPAFMVVIGGMGTFEGPIVGALLFSAVSYGTVVYFQGSSLDVLIFSIMIMAVAVLLPKGIVPTVTRIWHSIKR